MADGEEDRRNLTQLFEFRIAVPASAAYHCGTHDFSSEVAGDPFTSSPILSITCERGPIIPPQVSSPKSPPCVDSDD